MTPGERRYRERAYDSYSSARGFDPEHFNEAAISGRKHYAAHLIREHFPKHRTAAILDVGCGFGALVHHAHLNGYPNARGVDASPEQVRLAKTLGIAGIEQGDLVATLRGLAPASLEVVLAFDVLEHFTRDEALEVADLVSRALTHNGRWILHVPNAESPFFGRVRYGDITHETAYTRASLRQLLLGCGFSRIACFEERPIVHNIRTALRRFGWHAVRGALRFYLAAESGEIGSDAVLSQNMLAVAEK